MATEREQLQEALRSLRDHQNYTNTQWADLEKLVYDAAQKHLDRLPNTKRVWRVSHCEDGMTETWGIWSTEKFAIDSATTALKCGKSCVSINSYEVPA